MAFDKSLLKITPASFVLAGNLQDALGKALMTSGISIPGLKIDKDDPLNTDIGENIGGILNPAIGVIISKEVRQALFDVCENRVSYNKQKINIDFFEDVNNRPLYYPIMIEVVKENIGPFVASLFFQFKGLFEKIKGSLK